MGAPSPDTGRIGVFRTAVTKADGTFTLDLLPMERGYRVVSLTESGAHPHGMALSVPIWVGKGHPSSIAHDLLARPIPGSLATLHVTKFQGFDPAFALHELTLEREFTEPDGHTYFLVLETARYHQNGPRVFGPLAVGTYRVVFLQRAKPDGTTTPQDKHHATRLYIGPGETKVLE